jgi:hypothetical protein
MLYHQTDTGTEADRRQRVGARKGDGNTLGAILPHGLRRGKDSLIWIRRNPLKSLDSAKGIHGNPSFFPWSQDDYRVPLTIFFEAPFFH